MKKKLALLAACMMLLGAGSAFAATPASVLPGNAAAHAVKPVQKLQLMKEFQGEIHQINDLRTQRLETKQQIVQKQDQILDLTLAARENGDKEALKQAAEVHKQIHALQQEIDGLYQSMKAEVKAFREAVKNRDSEGARAHIDSAISIFGQVNGKLADKTALYDQMISILS